MEFRIAKAAGTTGRLLESLVRDQLKADGIPEPDCVICYGAGYSGDKPSLNAKCSKMNKLEQVVKVSAALPNESLWADEVTHEEFPTLPCVARKLKHRKGKDILVCRTPRQVRNALARGRSYFTPLIDSDTEYRIWVYRKRTLCAYEKRLTEPEKNKKFGRNRENGWTFHAVEIEGLSPDVKRVAVTAVAALDLDFGAVDILGKWDTTRPGMQPTVLEVNTAPGVSDEHRSGIQRLKHRIVRWCANGCPKKDV